MVELPFLLIQHLFTKNRLTNKKTVLPYKDNTVFYLHTHSLFLALYCATAIDKAYILLYKCFPFSSAFANKSALT